MFHKSEFDHLGHEFPHDQNGFVPVHGDHWRDLQFEHDGMDPQEAGISDEERKRRTEFLNTVWWPEVLKRVQNEHRRLMQIHGETFTEHWHRTVYQSPDTEHGFGVGVG